MMNRRIYFSAMAVLFLAMVIIASLLLTAWPAGEIVHFGLQELGSGTFELYGITFLILGILMFAAMMGGVFIAKEEDEE